MNWVMAIQSIASLVVLGLLLALAELLLRWSSKEKSKKQDKGFPYTRERGK